MNYYNDNDAENVLWLQQLTAANEIAPGRIDERSILELNAKDLRNYKQCHFFAGIGGWSLALRWAGWPDDMPVWTGSCPCQPFSIAGKRKVDADERHLWPAFRAAIAECRPPVVFGEQVASEDGRIWLAGIRADLEAMGYEVGAADLCAAGVSAPHIRQRLYWVAHAIGSEWRPPPEIRRDVADRENTGREEANGGPSICSTASDGLGKPNGNGRKPRCEAATPARHGSSVVAASGIDPRMVNADGYHGHWWSGPLQVGRNCCEGEIERGGRKYRAQWRIKPGLSLLADGVPGRVAQLCGFGNAIVPQLAATFIAAACDSFR